MRHLSLASILLLFAGNAIAQTPSSNDQPAPPPDIKSFDASAIDKTADPCTDFYQYACGNWVKDNPVPNDQSRWARSFSLVAERNRYLLWQELDAAAKSPKTPLEKKYGDYYAACMDTSRIDAEGLKPLASQLAAVDALKDPKQISELVSQLDSSGYSVSLFRFGVAQDQKDSRQQ